MATSEYLLILTGVRDATARICRPHRRRSRLAAFGAGAAAWQAADSRLPGREFTFGVEHRGCRFCAAAARTGLERGSQPHDRVSLGARAPRALGRDRG